MATIETGRLKALERRHYGRYHTRHDFMAASEAENIDYIARILKADGSLTKGRKRFLAKYRAAAEKARAEAGEPPPGYHPGLPRERRMHQWIGERHPEIREFRERLMKILKADENY